MNDYNDCPAEIKDYLFYLNVIKGRSSNTINGYYLDLRSFFRYINYKNGGFKPDTEFAKIPIDNINLDIIKSITLSDVYEFLHFASTTLNNSPITRARKVSSIRSFFNYLAFKKRLLDDNPVKELEVPSAKKSLPKYLTLEQCIDLLNNIDGEYKERDYCIITLFLNCGMRLSELVNIDLQDINNDTLRLIGKGNKERIVYLNSACLEAIKIYKNIRETYNIKPQNKNALFISRNGSRISKRRIQEIIEFNLKKSGLANHGFSTHKLRHTAATMMYQHGDVDIRILQEILGHANLGTTEIYTHTSSGQIKQAVDKNPLSKIKKK